MRSLFVSAAAAAMGLGLCVAALPVAVGAVAAAATAPEVAAVAPAAGLACGFGGMDFSPLQKSGWYISSSDWALFNYYWQPCGILRQTAGRGVPSACLPAASSSPDWAAVGLCRFQQFDFTAVSMADWSASGQVQWSDLDAQASKEHLLPSNSKGALLRFQSATANCSSAPGAPTQPFTASLAFVCDEAGLYDLHGPLDIPDESTCDVKFNMLTHLACAKGEQLTSAPAAAAAAVAEEAAPAEKHLSQSSEEEQPAPAPVKPRQRRHHHSHGKSGASGY